VRAICTHALFRSHSARCSLCFHKALNDGALAPRSAVRINHGAGDQFRCRWNRHSIGTGFLESSINPKQNKHCKAKQPTPKGDCSAIQCIRIPSVQFDICFLAQEYLLSRKMVCYSARALMACTFISRSTSPNMAFEHGSNCMQLKAVFLIGEDRRPQSLEYVARSAYVEMVESGNQRLNACGYEASSPDGIKCKKPYAVKIGNHARSWNERSRPSAFR
jgi:hypothetical protein